MMEYSDYEAQARTVRVEDITSNQRERGILQNIISNSNTLSSLNIGPDDLPYLPTNAHDLGWLGYFIGKNTQIRKVEIADLADYFDEDDMLPFFQGLSYNKRIEDLIFWHFDFSGGSVFRTLIPFFQGDQCLTKIELNQCNLGDEGFRLLSLALGGCNSLKHFELYDCDVTDSQSVTIIEALGGNAQLESIDIRGNDIGRVGCVALAKVFQLETTNVQYLGLRNNSIDDGGMEALMPVLAKNSNLHELKLDGNTSITIRGFGALSSVLESPTSNLEDLHIGPENVCDEVLKMLASVLASNNTLKMLPLNSNLITDEGWLALSQSLCNTSSINATYLSNHTLGNVVGGTHDSDLNSLVALNRSGYSKKQIAMMKILKYHDNFDMQPLFEWDFKVLPCMIKWFEKAAERPSYLDKFRLPDLEAMVQQRKLSAIYQFIRGMPLEFIEARSMHELKEFAARKKRLNSELKRLRNELDEVEDAERQILRSRASR